MFKVDFRDSGGGNRNDWYSEAGSSFSISLEGKRRRMPLCLTWEEEKSTLGHFLTCFQLHELKSQVQVQCIILEAGNKIPLCSPVKLISEELHNFL